MTTPETQEVLIALARIEERLANVQAQVSDFKERAHCDVRGEKIEELERKTKGMNAKWWATAAVVLAAWIKLIFWPGSVQ